jgi:hypothetical protein
MGHFYSQDGLLHECDIREARKNKWVAGTTEIIHEFENSYGLDLYKQKQMFLASLTMPRPEGITDEAFYDLVVEDSRVHSEKAKQFGIMVHFIVTEYFKNHNTLFENIGRDISKEINVANKIISWIKANEDNCIVDIKTTETKDGKFRQPYDSWLFQLCGYYLGKDLECGQEYIDYGFSTKTFGGTIDYSLLKDFEDVKLINLIVSSNEDIPIKVYPWKPEKIEWGCECFLKMVDLYNTMKKLR